MNGITIGATKIDQWVKKASPSKISLIFREMRETWNERKRLVLHMKVFLVSNLYFMIEKFKDYTEDSLLPVPENLNYYNYYLIT